MMYQNMCKVDGRVRVKRRSSGRLGRACILEQDYGAGLWSRSAAYQIKHQFMYVLLLFRIYTLMLALVETLYSVKSLLVIYTVQGRLNNLVKLPNPHANSQTTKTKCNN